MTDENHTHQPSRATVLSTHECTSESHRHSSPISNNDRPAHPTRGTRASSLQDLDQVKPTRTTIP
jgi:hypothetical protein